MASMTKLTIADLITPEGIELIKKNNINLLNAAAKRALKWQKDLCRTDDWSCKNCNECKELERVILNEEKE